MQIENLHIVNLRNHNETKLELASSSNILYGMNGVGKTTILEAISLLALTRSFLPVQDQSIMNNESQFYYIQCGAKTDLKTNYKIKIKYEKNKKKEISGTEGENLIPKNIIGLMPVVVLSPDHKAITFGSPSERRSFIDRTLSQASKKYIDLLLKHKKCLKQRNNILNDARKNDRNYDKILLEAWTNSFIDVSAEIILKRSIFIDDFKPYFNDIYKNITNDKEPVELKYIADNIDDSIPVELNAIKDKLYEIAANIYERELRRGTSLFGPQKDDLEIFINGGLAKEIASQGQHKSLLISLKFAEFNFLKDNKQETPIILLDDIFSELDSDRSGLVMQMLKENKAQTFITLTNREIIRPEFKDSYEIKYFEIDNGKVLR